ncbi:MAG: AmmeMemoRadiSam system radical SAM enzyme [Myxococcota bacterium]|nr:AmmeMemoRadiSam system radical SAM enzyme [Myxococcota bacterium]
MREEIEPFVVRGEFHTQLDNGRIRCDVCPRHCTLNDGQRAFCFVREARDGEVVLTSYGRSTGFCIDPIEKKPLNHFYPGSPVLSFGTAGCNLGCRFCQNWDISKAREIERLSARAGPRDIAAAAASKGCTSVAFTYNDPVIFLEYAVDTAEACRDLGIKSVAVSAGYISPKARKRFFGSLDAANIDLKAFTDQFYHKFCFAHLEPVLETLCYLKEETDVWFEVTTLLIPDENDSIDEIEKLSSWMVEHLGPDIPLHFTAFHPDYKLLDKIRTPGDTLTRARSIALEAGLHFVYTGNIHDSAGGSTWCPGCGKCLVERNWYVLGEWNIENNSCNGCGLPVPGHFESVPGDWGRKREALSLG